MEFVLHLYISFFNLYYLLFIDYEDTLFAIDQHLIFISESDEGGYSNKMIEDFFLSKVSLFFDHYDWLDLTKLGLDLLFFL